LETSDKPNHLQQNRKDPERLQVALQMGNMPSHKVVGNLVYTVLLVQRFARVLASIFFSPNWIHCHADLITPRVSQWQVLACQLKCDIEA